MFFGKHILVLDLGARFENPEYNVMLYKLIAYFGTKIKCFGKTQTVTSGVSCKAEGEKRRFINSSETFSEREISFYIFNLYTIQLRSLCIHGVYTPRKSFSNK